ncbi:hypothetical protein [Actinomadura gamaensis]|uniref:Uncharacterized protein n=1 Tax=Actinomadura gamaensis TaxID=1763541 RepID=A0ABV9UDA7_9ACTN
MAAAGRPTAELQAKSWHLCLALASLGRHARLGEQASAALTAEHDPHARRRPTSSRRSSS